MQKLLQLFNPGVDKNIKLIATATSLRWFGWGFVEAFMPVFLFTFSGTYAETGILKSVYGIMFLLSLPIVSWFVDRMPSKKLMFAAIAVYPIISLSYFAAGSWGIIAFIVVARILNGVGYALDSTVRATYVRRHTTKGKVAAVFGYLESYTNFWWLIAVGISVLAVNYVDVPYLFLPIAITAILSMFIIAALPKDKSIPQEKTEKTNVFQLYGTFFKVIWGWSKKVRWLAIIAFLGELISTMGEFFIPIYAYTQNESLANVMLLTAFATLPTLLSVPLGVVADKYKKTIFSVCACIALLLFSLATIDNFPIQLCVVLLVSIALQLLHLAIDREVTFQVPQKEIGTLSGAFQGVSQLAEIVGPIFLGVVIDLFDLPTVLICLAVLCVFLGAYGYAKKIL